MKTLLLMSLGLFAFNVFAQDLAQQHEALCKSEKAVELMGEKGSCRMVFGKGEAREMQGSCIGQFKKFMMCQVNYVVTKDVSGMQILCGTDLEKPTLDQTLRAESSTYTVAAVISKADQTQTVINESGLNTVLDGKALSLVLNTKDEQTEAKIMLNLKTGPVELTNVQCF